MKKVILTFALVLTTMVASAQVYVGGGLNFSKEATTKINVNPEVGYAINENWTVGAVLGFDWTKDVETKFNINPYARYTFYKAGNFSFFADGVVELGVNNPNVGDSQFCWGIGVKPGIAYSFTEHICAAAHVGWLGHRDNGGEYTAISVNGNELSFSLYYNF